MNTNIVKINANKKKLPRMRTIPKAYEEIKKIDPDTCISMRGLRDLVSSGNIPTVKIKNKVLNFPTCKIRESLEKERENNKKIQTT